jgi:hypothetical protein
LNYSPNKGSVKFTLSAAFKSGKLAVKFVITKDNFNDLPQGKGKESQWAFEQIKFFTLQEK